MRNKRQRIADFQNLKRAEQVKKNKRINCICENCGKQVSLPPSVVKRGWRFCSRECRYIKMRGDCGPNANGGFWMRGNKNPNWKGGYGYERRQRYKEAEIARWRRRVFARDKYTCQKCGKRSRVGMSVVLHAHHIKPFAKFPELRFEVDNGQTLCKDCHYRKPKGAEVWLIT